MNATRPRPLLACLLAILPAALAADEGMWLFNDLPLEALKERHGFTPPAGWAERLMRAAVRLSSGGSGSIISSEGLVMTNHHVGSDALQKLSTPGKNLLEEGFVARSRAEELRCPDLEVLALAEIVDVTERVNAAAAAAGDDSARREKARREAIATIEKESKDATGLHSQVVTLFHGGAFHLYRYRRWDDVRLVMAPETSIAFFGGDPDNFEFPRFCLDVCFFRLYEQGKPAQVENFLPWSGAELRDGDLVFVAGHPGATQRLNTLDHLRYLRDVQYPAYLEMLARREIALEQFSLRGAEFARMARDDNFAVENSRKALRGMLAGLLEPEILRAKALAESELRAAAAADPSLGATPDDWERIRSSRDAYRKFRVDYELLESNRAFWSQLYRIAKMLVRLAEEKEKPNPERLPGYRESDLETLELELFSPAPIYPELEKATLADSLTALTGSLGAEHPLVRMVLAGRSPNERARELVSGTTLADPARRREVAAGGKEAIKASRDPMVALARAVDPYARALRRQYEDLVEGVEKDAYGNIARARFAVRGKTVYPDATFTLRLALGVVKGWREGDEDVRFYTTLGGTFEHSEAHGGKEPYNLPATWLKARERLNPTTQFNFCCTADIVGGNSGSPVVNRAGEVVGIIFDGNIHSLVLDIQYTEEKARSVAVCAGAIVEAIRKVYGQEALAAEIAGPRR